MITTSSTPSLILCPVELGETPQQRVLPEYNKSVIKGLRYFIVEEIRSARRFLKRVDKDIDIDALTFYPMGKHADAALFEQYLKPLDEGESIGVISRIVDEGGSEDIDLQYYARYQTEDGEEVEGLLSNPSPDLEEGQQVRLKYHPKYRTNARLIR